MVTASAMAARPWTTSTGAGYSSSLTLRAQKPSRRRNRSAWAATTGFAVTGWYQAALDSTGTGAGNGAPDPNVGFVVPALHNSQGG